MGLVSPDLTPSSVGFPCNQFLSQEPAKEADIEEFVCTTFRAKFPMFSKIDVNGKDAHPLWAFMKVLQLCAPGISEYERNALLLQAAKPGLLGFQVITWNFTAFLVDRSGRVVERFEPTHTLEATASPYIEKLL